MKHMRFLPVLLLLSVQVSAQQSALPSIIPAPVDMMLNEGTCSLGCPWAISGSATLPSFIADEILSLHPAEGLQCLVAVPISFNQVDLDSSAPLECYKVEVKTSGIEVSATSEAGLFRGSRTLIQLLEQGRASGSLPCLTITDHPRFPWRGMHMDPCRHFWSVDFTKKYIDLLARYKMNSFHWHLTDDQGWRIEIKKHPKLTEVGAWRKGSQVGPYSRREYDSIPYGGFYTQDEIREVVAYAKARHINVVPEIEMPGHALAALAGYPHLGCTGGPYEVNKGWGVFEDVCCAGNDSTFAMLEDVLTEVMELFPSEIIHIGGDESPKERWKACAKCQRRIRAEGLKDEHELQSYFIRRIEKFVNSKGRKIIGWDEILEGGLAPNAAVMSWQGTEGGIAAARSGHYAVMSPGSHCYFDHYQGDPANEPLAIGGYTPLQKVYAYEPIPAELKPEEHKYILGAQGNVWTEYILTPEHMEYMAVPRMLALAEVLWTPKAKRNEADFIQRLEKEFVRLEEMKVNASRSLYSVRVIPKAGKRPGEISVELVSPLADSIMFELMPHIVEAFYGTPGQDSIPMNRRLTYEAPIPITTNRMLIASTFKAGRAAGSSVVRVFGFDKATAQKITLSEQPHERYNEGGAFTLVDGITAQQKRVNTEWLGWRKGVTITVDLGSVHDISYIGIGALNETYGWIHAPKVVEFSTSTDGKTYTSLGMDVPTMQEIPLISADPLRRKETTYAMPQGRHVFHTDKAAKARYIKLTVQHIGPIPQGYPGAGSPAWMFLDEIEVR
ncbi:MAG: family 20 glycosylhydrolase [Flavobacteriales bacterium]|nr:family 20 glycosylhydrolase [Flavobacteriales bacterium]